MDVLACAESQQGVSGVVADLRLNRHDLSLSEQFILGNEAGPELGASRAAFRGMIADSDKIPIRRRLCDLDLIRPMGIGDA